MPAARSKKRDTKLYDVLEVSPEATTAQITKAYKTAAMKYHPDRNPEAPPEKFKEISAAYDVLKDEHKKDVYDRYGLEGLKEGVSSESATSLFDLFMGGGHHRHQGPPKGPSKLIPLKVTLECLYNGETKSVSFTRKIACQKCHGSGCKEGRKRVHCRSCHGQGVRMGTTRMGPLTFQQPVQCRECDGEGEIIAQKDKCVVCHGHRIVDEEKSLDVVILPGYASDKRIKFRGENDQLPGAEAGDVHVLIEQEKHSVFERLNDNDLLIRMKINLNESLTGFKRVIQHLDGRDVLIQHPANQPIIPNSTKRIEKQGMISMETHHTGDLIIRFDVEFPPMNFFNDPLILQKLESLLPSKPVLQIRSDVHIDEATEMLEHKTNSSSKKSHSKKMDEQSNEDDDDDQYTDADEEEDDDEYEEEEDEDEDEDGEPHVQSCQTH